MFSGLMPYCVTRGNQNRETTQKKITEGSKWIAQAGLGTFVPLEWSSKMRKRVQQAHATSAKEEDFETVRDISLMSENAPAMDSEISRTYLRCIRLQNFALVADEYIEFGPGMNVVTGESGSGKSVLIEALQLLLGSSATEACIRKPAKFSRIEGSFVISEDKRYQINSLLEVIFSKKSKQEIDFQIGGSSSCKSLQSQPHYLSLIREIYLTKKGELRSRCYINGMRTNVRSLRNIGVALVDVATQNANLGLKTNDTQLRILDSIAGVMPLRSHLSCLWQQWKDLKDQLMRIEMLSDETRREAIQELVDDVEAAYILPQEDEMLRKKLRQLDSRRNTIERCQLVCASFGGGNLDGGILNALYDTEQNLRSALDEEKLMLAKTNAGEVDDWESEYEESSISELESSNMEEPHEEEDILVLLENALQSVRDAYDSLNEAQNSVKKFGRRYHFDQREYDETLERIQDIQRIMKKHGALTLSELLSRAKEGASMLDAYHEARDSQEDIQQHEKELEQEVAQIASYISVARKRSATQLENIVNGILEELAMPHARFRISMTRNQDQSGDNVKSSGRQALSIPKSLIDRNSLLSDVGAGIYAGKGDKNSNFEAADSGVVLVSETGFDSISFIFAAGPEEPLLELHDVASGGETSRLMLAIKAAPIIASIGDQNGLEFDKNYNEHAYEQLKVSNETLVANIKEGTSSFFSPALMVLDEIDSGIGARLGHQVGQIILRMSSDTFNFKLKRSQDEEISVIGGRSKDFRENEDLEYFNRSRQPRPCQVICVSHLPQVAAYAEHHICVTKLKNQDGRILTCFKTIENENERLDEISSMMGLGSQAAQQLLQSAAKFHGRN